MAEDDPGKKVPGELNVSTHYAISLYGQEWRVNVRPLAVPNSLSATLSAPDGDGGADFYLDWHDVIANPQRARMHMYPGAEKRVPYEVKLARMENFVGAIQAYHSLMPDMEHALTEKEIENLINGQQLPMPHTVVLDTGTLGLRELFSRLGFPIDPEPPNPFTPDWYTLAGKATSGELLTAWKAMKNNP